MMDTNSVVLAYSKQSGRMYVGAYGLKIPIINEWQTAYLGVNNKHVPEKHRQAQNETK